MGLVRWGVSNKAASCVLGRTNPIIHIYKHTKQILLEKKHIKEEAVIVRQLVWVPQEKRVCLT